MYEADGGRGVEGGDVELRGTRGNLVVSDRGYRISPTEGGQFQNRGMLTEPVEKTREDPEDSMRNTPTESAANLISNFLECVKSRKRPLCDLETGHRSNSSSLLANIAEDAGTHIEWDPEKERVVNNEAANELLHYGHREPWTLG